MVQVLSDIIEVVVLTARTDAFLRVRRRGELRQSQGRVGGSQEERLKLATATTTTTTTTETETETETVRERQREAGKREKERKRARLRSDVTSYS